MHDGKPVTLYRNDGTEVVAKPFKTNPRSNLMEGLVTDDGRLIYCRDETRGLFWFRDTQEELFLAPQPSTHS